MKTRNVSRWVRFVVRATPILYHEGKILDEGVVPREIIYGCKHCWWHVSVAAPDEAEQLLLQQ